MSEKPILGYWNTHGIGQPIRYMLKYLGVDFVDKQYKLMETEGPLSEKTAQEMRADWLPVKHTLGLEFPNLPYYIDGDVKITQSMAILKYLGRKHGLVLNNENSKIRVDMAEGLIWDFFANFWRTLLLDPNYDQVKDKMINEKLPNEVGNFSKLLGKNDWVGGDKISHIDFILYEVVYWISLLDPPSIKKHPNLEQFLKRFESLPAIEKYRKSDEFSAWPITAPIAKFGWKK